ncbi:MAG: arylsulfotransferase family protein [candidate division KSB1 bacterium]|nr:arylsulfotransferase family protein [candidate division KSB1 bacterium]
MMQAIRHKINWSKIWFLFSWLFLLFVFSFSWGFLSAKFKVFPYYTIRNTIMTASTVQWLFKNNVTTSLSANEISASRTRGGVTINKLIQNKDQFLLTTLYKNEEFVAIIMDREGNNIHEWKIPYKQQKLFMAKDTKVSLSKKNLMIHGASLDDKGNIYLVIEFRGLIKLNSASENIWTLHMPVHHAVTVDKDKSIWTISRNKINDTKDWIPFATQPYWNDLIVHISPEGEIIESFSVLDIIFDNQYEGILYGGHPARPAIHHEDPLHVNDVRIMTQEQAGYFKNVNPGDLIISMRTINTVMIVDRHSHSILWTITGPFLRQHSPRISATGSLLVFDNRTARGQTGGAARYLTDPQALDYSRLLSIDLKSRVVEWQYQGTVEHPFYTSIQGWLEELDNGDILAVESEGGRIFQIDLKTDKIVWEYINLIKKGVVGRVTQATPVSEHQISALGKNN